jgi:DNA polymerase I
MKKIYLVDAMSMVFRAFHAMGRSGLTNPNGEPSGAVFGFANILTKLIETHSPDHLAIVFDTSAPTFRHEIYPEYKANRAEFPEELIPQIPRIKHLIDLLGIPQIELDGYEADDIIATLSHEASENKIENYLITSDKDFMQLIDDFTFLLKPSKESKDGLELISFDGVRDKFGVGPHQVIEIQAIIGDSVDNIPGVKGIGPKGAAPLIEKYGTLENLYEHIAEIDKKPIKTKLEENREMAFLSKKLVTLKQDVPIDFKIEDCKSGDIKYAELDSFFSGMGFRALRKKYNDKSISERIGDWKSDISDTEEINNEFKSEFDNINTVKHNYELINTVGSLNKLIARLENSEEISFDLETDGLDVHSCNIVGIALSDKEFSGYYIPVYDPENVHTSEDLFAEERDFSDSLDINIVISRIKPLLEYKNIGKIGQNTKFDTLILNRFGINVKPITFDSMLAQYILNPDKKQGMDSMAETYLNYSPVPISKLIGEKKKGQKSMADLLPGEISDYACEDADVTLRLKNVLLPILKKENLDKLARDLEFPTVEVLTKIEMNGVAIDRDALKQLEIKISKEIEKLKKLIFEEAGIEFNIDSPKQLAHILFEKLMIPPSKKTKTGFSTDVGVLTDLAEIWDIAKYLLEYRSLAKLNSTYVKSLPRLVNKRTGRIHTTYNQSVASTGRLSSVNPNLQNIPIKTKLGKEVRKAFISTGENILLAADYSQIELRIMAFISEDSHLKDSFKQKIDFHAATASKIFSKELDDVTPDDRRIAKTVNFGILYGQGAFGLSKSLSISRKEAKDLIDNYFDSYPSIRNYIDKTVEFTREHGYAETLLGRRRYFPDIVATNRNLRSAAERAAINMPIQGSASDMIKLAMLAIYKEMEASNMKSKMILQVHDEIVFEVVPSELEFLSAMVKEKMESALNLGDVPVVVDIGSGKNWYEAH